VNEYLREASGGPFTAKDFRTWYATIAALATLRKLPVGNKGEVKRQMKKVIAAVAARLGNTPTICRKCYIHPEVLLAYAEGRLVKVVGTTTAGALHSLLRKRGRKSRS
jgi:DNA topoisomerase I